jgi:AraC-like DNA-binding protein
MPRPGDLAGDEDLVAGLGLHPTAHDFLGDPGFGSAGRDGIELGGVEEIHAALKSPVHDPEGRRFVGLFPECHRPESDFRNHQSASTEPSQIHGPTESAKWAAWQRGFFIDPRQDSADAGSMEGRRTEWLASLAPDAQVFRLFDHIPDILFFAKDRAGHLLAANRPLLDHYGYREEADFIGITDFELLPHSLAVKFRRDDTQVMESGRPLIDLVEIFVDGRGIPGWFLTTKLPLRDRSGEIAGVMGIIQPYSKLQANLPEDLDISRALDRIQAGFTGELPVSELAECAGLSVRQFERRFRKHLKTTPQEFIINMRIFRACELLRETRLSLGELALECGFYDQSSLSRLFRKHMGTTPLQYRKRFR